MRKTPELIFSLVILLFAFAGLYLNSGIPAGKPRKNMFVYYTNLSNLLVLIYELFFYFSGLFAWKSVSGFMKNAAVSYTVALTIFVTHIIYHYVLGAAFARAGIERDRSEGMGEEEIKRTLLRRYMLDQITGLSRNRYDDGRSFWGNLLVHYLVPLLSVLRWLIFSSKALAFWATLTWLVVPLAYFIFVLLRAKTGVPITKGGAMYPYPFMDRDALGERRFWRNIFIVMLAFYALGLIFYLITLLY